MNYKHNLHKVPQLQLLVTRVLMLLIFSNPVSIFLLFWLLLLHTFWRIAHLLPLNKKPVLIHLLPQDYLTAIDHPLPASLVQKKQSQSFSPQKLKEKSIPVYILDVVKNTQNCHI